MKMMHLSDLHLGKRVHEFSMLEDQRYILRQILARVEKERPDAVVIAGDVYDKTVPPAEAVQLFDEFLCGLADRQTEVFVISGNHDSAERISFGGRLMEKSGVHLAPVYQGDVNGIFLEDAYGKVQFFLLPFVKPVHVRRFYEEETIESYTDALRVAVAHMDRDPEARQVLVTHQFVTGAIRSDSEEISVGGADNVDAEVLEGFDYVALGHIHRAQKVGKETVRYCGTPLKYSVSEADHEKSITMVELKEKGNVTVQTIPLEPMRDLRTIRGTYLELTAREYYQGTNREDYLQITLTDEEDVPDAMRKLQVIYPNLMKLEYDNVRTRSSRVLEEIQEIEQKSPLELFAEFYEQQNNQPMSKEQMGLMQQIIEQVWEGNV